MINLPGAIVIIAIVLAPLATTIQAVIAAHLAMTAAHLAVIAAAQVHLQAGINFSDKSPLTRAFYTWEKHTSKKNRYYWGVIAGIKK